MLLQKVGDVKIRTNNITAMVNADKAPLIGQIVTWVAVAIVVPLALLTGRQFAAIIVVLFAVAGIREYRTKMDAVRKRERARKEADGIIVPDELQPAPPADPTPRTPREPRRPPQDPPEFPI